MRIGSNSTYDRNINISGSATQAIIKAGKIADIIAVSGNPLQDISAMGDVSFVMKAGTVYKPVN